VIGVGGAAGSVLRTHLKVAGLNSEEGVDEESLMVDPGPEVGREYFGGGGS